MTKDIEYGVKRYKLVKQLKAKGIQSEDVLRALGSVPREIFAGEGNSELCYKDCALPIDCGQTISQPYTVAYMTELLNTFPSCRVLEIGTGSGYQSAVLFELGCRVFSVERHKELYNSTKTLLAALNIDVEVFLGDGSQGLPRFAPYDRIIVTAASPKLSKLLASQLEIGGRMVVPIGKKDTQIMTVVTRQAEDDFLVEKKDKFRFVPLIGKEGFSGKD